MTKFPIIIWYLIIFLALTLDVKAQLSDNSAIEFHQYFKNYTSINPASEDSAYKFRLNLGNRTFEGLYEGVNRYYIDLDIKIKNAKTKFSNAGIFISRFNDGDFISRSKYYGRYSITTKLNSRSSISVGAALGVVNFTFMPSQTGGGGYDNVLDGNIGLWYLRKKLKLGVSYQQIFKTYITPISQQFELSPIYNFNAIHHLKFNPFLILKTHVFLNYQTRNYYNIQLAPVFLFYNKLEIGANLQFNKGISILTGLESIPVGIGTIKLMGSFLIRTAQFSNSSDNVFELSAGYSF